MSLEGQVTVLEKAFVEMQLELLLYRIPDSDCSLHGWTRRLRAMEL
jgi:hypothetical protein